MIGPTMIMYLIRKTNQTNPEKFTEKVKKNNNKNTHNSIIEKMDFLKHQDSCSRQESRYTCYILAK